MKKLLLVVALVASIGFISGLFAAPADAFFMGGNPLGSFFGGAKASCPPPCYVPYTYCAPAVACKPAKKAKKDAPKAATKPAKPAKDKK